MNLFWDVRKFHQKFGLPYFFTAEGKPHLLDPDVQQFRERFLEEELGEFEQACAAGDLAKAADALVDLVYVALGTAHMMHVPFDDVWRAVQEANMAKERASGSGDARSTRGHTMDVVKPAGWRPPDVAGVLRRFGADI